MKNILTGLIFILIPLSVFAENDQMAVHQFQQDLRELEKKKSELSTNEVIGEAGKIMDRLEENSSDENKRLVSAVKDESMLFYKELADYDTFLNKIADPSFFNFEKGSNLENLSQQEALAGEYKQKSEALLNYAVALPDKIKQALKKKGFNDSTIQSVLKGISDAEAEKTNTPKDVLTLRVQHAEILKDGLSWLKLNFGKWKFDSKEGYLGFDKPELSNYWENKVVNPLLLVEASLNEAVKGQVKTDTVT